jgi:fatty acid desaturase
VFLFVTHLPLRGLLLLRLGYFLRFFEVSSLVSRGIFAQGSHSSVEWPWLARIFCLFCHSMVASLCIAMYFFKWFPWSVLPKIIYYIFLFICQIRLNYHGITESPFQNRFFLIRFFVIYKN